MAIGAAAVLGGALAGFSGGLGYGTGLQYSYSRGFPAFQSGGMEGMYDTLRSDLQPIYSIFGNALSGEKPTNRSGLTYDEWQKGASPKPDLRKSTSTGPTLQDKKNIYNAKLKAQPTNKVRVGYTTYNGKKQVKSLSLTSWRKYLQDQRSKAESYARSSDRNTKSMAQRMAKTISSISSQIHKQTGQWV